VVRRKKTHFIEESSHAGESGNKSITNTGVGKKTFRGKRGD
jgi:hypothetical protein